MTDSPNRMGSRQHDRKRDKFSQVYDLMQDIQVLSEKAVEAMQNTQAVPIMQVASIHAKVAKLWSLLEVKRG